MNRLICSCQIFGWIAGKFHELEMALAIAVGINVRLGAEFFASLLLGLGGVVMWPGWIGGLQLHSRIKFKSA